MAGWSNIGSNSSSITAYSLEGGGRQTERDRDRQKETETDRDRQRKRDGESMERETQDARRKRLFDWPLAFAKVEMRHKERQR